MNGIHTEQEERKKIVHDKKTRSTYKLAASKNFCSIFIIHIAINYYMYVNGRLSHTAIYYTKYISRGYMVGFYFSDGITSLTMYRSQSIDRVYKVNLYCIFI